MAQLILAGIALIGLKLIWDVYNDYQGKRGEKTPKKGQVIDLSEAWIDMNNLPYKSKDSLLTRSDLAIFHLINAVIDVEKYVLLPKVRLEEILSSASNVNNAEEYLHRLKERSADFVICALPDLKPQLVIMSENTADSKKKQLSDRFNKRAFEEAGIPIISINASAPPSASDLSQELQKAGIK